MRKIYVTLIISLASIAMIVAGVMGGEVNVMFNKAIRICLECIGVG